MVKHYGITSAINFTWNQVAVALWNRYPNPYSKHVLTEDVISRDVRDGKLYSKRLLTKTSSVPKWAQHFVASHRIVTIVEESVVDPSTRTFTTYTRNIGMNSIMSIDEKCLYRIDSENKHWTTCDRQAWVDSKFFGFARAIKAYGVERYKKNVSKTAKGMDYILTKMFLPEHHVTNAEKLRDTARDTARKATEIAQAKTRSILQTN